MAKGDRILTYLYTCLLLTLPILRILIPGAGDPGL